MNAKVVLLTLLALIVLGVVILRYRAGMSALHVDPHAAEQIQKAKQR